MKILALTDIHGSYKKAVEIIAKHPSDVVIMGGDLTTVGTVREAEGALREMQSFAGRLLCVAGNMDLPAHDDLLARLGISLNGRGVMVDGTGFFGVSAAPISPLHTPYEITEEEIGKRIRSGYLPVKDCSVTIFVPHAPPYGTKVDIIHSGIHVGSTAIRDFIEQAQPTVAVCGHIHEARGQDSLERTKIVNCGPAFNGCYATIEIGDSILIENRQLGH
jgi:Icc-related predicted phosphoesterase